MKKKKRYNYEDYEDFDVLDDVDSEEIARGYIEVSAEGDAGLEISVERVEDAWDVANQASKRHGFPITPAIAEAYAKARAIAEAYEKERAIAESHTFAFKFRAFLKKIKGTPPHHPEPVTAPVR